MAESGRLSPKQTAAIAALMVSRNLREAAKKADVPERTLYRWVKHNDGFRAALHDAEAELLGATMRVLLTGTHAAVAVMAGIMADDKTVPSGVRLRAATSWLDQARSWYETETLEGRLDDLEGVVYGNQDKG